MARKILPGNRIYTVFRAYNDLNKKFMVVAENQAKARKLAVSVQKRIGERTDDISVLWNIHDGNHGITTLPIGSVIYPKTSSTNA